MVQRYFAYLTSPIFKRANFLEKKSMNVPNVKVLSKELYVTLVSLVLSKIFLVILGFFRTLYAFLENGEWK